MNIMDIKDEVEEHGKLPLECDGFTRVFEYLLKMRDIKHQCYSGDVTFNGKTFPVHYWIVSGNYIVDYALNIWFDKTVPNGLLEIESIKRFSNKTIIKIKDHQLAYDGRPMSFETSKAMYEILTRELK